ncbi:hypothetical protein [Variovorax sp. JS1663]|uniref:hypothetical protein n=1 Tax=Variovorax sp. JS1663 TaxID=1851577 RepID=UPI000B343498|nr:hypothetical protein [Variovorax sp. JS1663]OUL97942.1 hypothetical protein A8M77_34225 [Variovorax sp. JS1663]
MRLSQEIRVRNIQDSPYAPVRLSEQIWWEFAVRAKDAGWIREDGTIAGNLPDAIFDDLCKPMVQEMEQVLDINGLRDHLPQYDANMLRLRQWVPLIGQYESCGRQIFDLDDDLADELAVSALPADVLHAWKPPFRSFFVRFGKVEAASLPFAPGESEFLDGVFVGVSPWDLSGALCYRFGFSMIKEDGGGLEMPGPLFDLTPAESHLPFREAVEAAHSRRLKELDVDDRSGTSTPWTKAVNSMRRGESGEVTQLAMDAAPLLMNALFLLEQKLDQVEPGRDAPPEAQILWEMESARGRRRLVDELAVGGYAVVRRVQAKR